MKNISLFTCISLCVMACSSSEKETEPGSTSLSFCPERTEKKQMVYDFTVESPEQKAKLNFIIEAGTEIIPLTDSTTEIIFVYDKIRLTGQVDTLKIDVDASNPDSNQIEGMLYGQPYFICLNHRFSVTYDTKMNRLDESLLSTPDSGMMAPIINKIHLFTALPGKAVEIGDEWNSSIELKSGKDHTVDAVFKLDKIENEVAYISFSGTRAGSGTPYEQNYTLEGSVKGTLEVDCKSGLTLRSEMTQDVVLTMNEKQTPMKFTIRQYFK